MSGSNAARRTEPSSSARSPSNGSGSTGATRPAIETGAGSPASIESGGPPSRSGGFGRSAALRTILIYGGVVVVFCAIAIGLELVAGHPLEPGHAPEAPHSVADAFWHLGTAFLLVLPARRRVLLWAAPVLALSIDVDHLFGGVLPTVVPREAHDLFFILVVVAVLWRIEGAPAAALAAGATLAHIGVDGGLFPFLAPATTAQYALPMPAAFAMLIAAGVLFFVATRPGRAVLEPRFGVPLVAAIVSVVLLVAFVPALNPFNQS